MLSIQFWGGGRRNSRLRLLVGVTAALLGASNSFLFFCCAQLQYTGFASIFSSFSIFFFFFLLFLLLVLVTVFLTLVKSSWTTFSCQFRCENIVDEVFNWFRSTFKRNGPCHMPPHGSASIFVRFRDIACEINFNRFRAVKIGRIRKLLP